jgi:hypothetical protein
MIDYMVRGEDGAFHPATEEELRDELRGEQQYQFQVGEADGGYVSIQDNDGNILQLMGEVGILINVEKDEMSDSVMFEPTEKFWEYLVYVNQLTSKMAEHHRHARGAVAQSLPEPEAYKHPTPRDVPKYERRILFHLSSTLFERRLEYRDTMARFPRFRRLFRRAYEETDNEVPEYLQDFVYESDESASSDDNKFVPDPQEAD